MLGPAHSTDAMQSSRHELIPFFLAVEHVFRRVYTDRTLIPASPSKAHLDGLAYAIAGVASVLVYDARDGRTRPLTEEEINRGLFRGGGETLHFLDGRTPLRNLALRAMDIDAIVKVLIAGFPVDGDT
jgi:hypothetical protein